MSFLKKLSSVLWFVVAFSNCFTIVGNSSYKNKIISNAVNDVLGVYKEIAEDSQLRVEEFFTKYFTLYALILSVQGYYRDDREFEKELSEVFVENKNELESAIKNNMKKIQAAPFIKNIGFDNAQNRTAILSSLELMMQEMGEMVLQNISVNEVDSKKPNAFNKTFHEICEQYRDLFQENKKLIKIKKVNFKEVVYKSLKKIVRANKKINLFINVNESSSFPLLASLLTIMSSAAFDSKKFMRAHVLVSLHTNFMAMILKMNGIDSKKITFEKIKKGLYRKLTQLSGKTISLLALTGSVAVGLLGYAKWGGSDKGLPGDKLGNGITGGTADTQNKNSNNNNSTLDNSFKNANHNNVSSGVDAGGDNNDKIVQNAPQDSWSRFKNSASTALKDIKNYFNSDTQYTFDGDTAEFGEPGYSTFYTQYPSLQAGVEKFVKSPEEVAKEAEELTKSNNMLEQRKDRRSDNLREGVREKWNAIKNYFANDPDGAKRNSIELGAPAYASLNRQLQPLSEEELAKIKEEMAKNPGPWNRFIGGAKKFFDDTVVYFANVSKQVDDIYLTVVNAVNGYVVKESYLYLDTQKNIIQKIKNKKQVFAVQNGLDENASDPRLNAINKIIELLEDHKKQSINNVNEYKENILQLIKDSVDKTKVSEELIGLKYLAIEKEFSTKAGDLDSLRNEIKSLNVSNIVSEKDIDYLLIKAPSTYMEGMNQQILNLQNGGSKIIAVEDILYKDAAAVCSSMVQYIQDTSDSIVKRAATSDYKYKDGTMRGMEDMLYAVVNSEDKIGKMKKAGVWLAEEAGHVLESLVKAVDYIAKADAENQVIGLGRDVDVNLSKELNQRTSDFIDKQVEMAKYLGNGAFKRMIENNEFLTTKHTDQEYDEFLEMLDTLSHGEQEAIERAFVKGKPIFKYHEDKDQYEILVEVPGSNFGEFAVNTIFIDKDLETRAKRHGHNIAAGLTLGAGAAVAMPVAGRMMFTAERKAAKKAGVKIDKGIKRDELADAVQNSRLAKMSKKLRTQRTNQKIAAEKEFQEMLKKEKRAKDSADNFKGKKESPEAIAKKEQRRLEKLKTEEINNMGNKKSQDRLNSKKVEELKGKLKDHEEVKKDLEEKLKKSNTSFTSRIMQWAKDKEEYAKQIALLTDQHKKALAGIKQKYESGMLEQKKLEEVINKTEEALTKVKNEKARLLDEKLAAGREFREIAAEEKLGEMLELEKSLEEKQLLQDNLNTIKEEIIIKDNVIKELELKATELNKELKDARDSLIEKEKAFTQENLRIKTEYTKAIDELALERQNNITAQALLKSELEQVNLAKAAAESKVEQINSELALTRKTSAEIETLRSDLVKAQKDVKDYKDRAEGYISQLEKKQNELSVLIENKNKIEKLYNEIKNDMLLQKQAFNPVKQEKEVVLPSTENLNNNLPVPVIQKLQPNTPKDDLSKITAEEAMKKRYSQEQNRLMLANKKKRTDLIAEINNLDRKIEKANEDVIAGGISVDDYHELIYKRNQLQEQLAQLK